ncbi:carbohydrate ABC transporter permease [Paenibacillus chungangensis]|uniref:Carbohydrate ABC transporter permease n=1 Tax=Paenibacillus chungangensis TaxID=696535 RepID=A0ABW3HR74_9BACL
MMKSATDPLKLASASRSGSYGLRWRAGFQQFILYVLLSAILLLTLVPILFMAVSSLKSNAQILGSFWGLPSPPQWDNFSEAGAAIWRYVMNTVLYALGGSLAVIVLSTLAGYVFAKKQFPGKETLFMMMLGLMMIPGILTLIPSYVLYAHMGLTNTPWVILLQAAAGGQIFGIFLSRTFIAGLPNEIFDAARIDGAGEREILFKLVFPLSMPIISTIFIMQAVGIYNDYIWPLLTISDAKIQMLGVGLTLFMNQFGITDMGVQFAAYTISSFPLVLIFSFGMKYFIQGMTSGAIKM